MEDAMPAARELLHAGSLKHIYVPEEVAFSLHGAYLVFFMQAGFALLEAGCVRAKNTKNILLKNVLDACMGAIIWWAFGWPLAYGSNDIEGFKGLMGGQFEDDYYGGGFFMNQQDQADSGIYASWMFQWAFAATAATIVSGAVAERCSIPAYACYTTVLTAFVYPVAVHVGWSTEGFLSAFYIGEDGSVNPARPLLRARCSRHDDPVVRLVWVQPRLHPLPHWLHGQRYARRLHDHPRRRRRWLHWPRHRCGHGQPPRHWPRPQRHPRRPRRHHCLLRRG